MRGDNEERRSTRQKKKRTSWCASRLVRESAKKERGSPEDPALVRTTLGSRKKKGSPAKESLGRAEKREKKLS